MAKEDNEYVKIWIDESLIDDFCEKFSPITDMEDAEHFISDSELRNLTGAFVNFGIDALPAVKEKLKERGFRWVLISNRPCLPVLLRQQSKHKDLTYLISKVPEGLDPDICEFANSLEE